jgi:branched-chain amino acid transport system permease protein
MNTRVVVVAALLALYAGVPLALGSNLYVMSTIVASLVIGGVALSWALLGNLGGLVSFGHAAFFGVGAYASSLCVMKLGLPVLPAMLLGGLASSLASLAMLPALRLRGPYFALAVLAYAQIFRIVATEWKGLTNGAGGLSSIPPLPHILGFDLAGKTGNYVLILTIVLAFALIYARVRRSHYGLALRAMHEGDEAVRVLGVNSTLLKGAMLLLSAFMAGVVGAFNAHTINFLEPDYAFASSWTVLPIVAGIFGGYRTITGPLAGAVVIYLADQLAFKAIMPSGHQIVLGALLCAMVLFSPGGLLPLLAGRYARVIRARA